MATYTWPPAGAVSVSSAPIQFNKNGSATTVSLDTSTPANSTPLPVVITNPDGTQPTGLATAAKQDTGNTSLTSIDTKTPALVSGNVPVQLPASQITTLTPPTTITANQGTGGASAWKVDGSGVTQPISASVLPLPTGAATSAKQPAIGTAGSSSVDVISIQGVAGGTSVPTSISGTVSTSNADLISSGTITIVNSNPNSGTATAGSAVAVSLNGQNTISIQVTGTYTGVLTPQVTVDGTNWIAINGLINVNTGAQAATIGSGGTGIFQIEASACAQFRLTALAAVTGTATVTLRASVAQSAVSIDNSLPTGSNTIGAVTVTGTLTTVSTVTAVTAITNALPTGTNVIGKFVIAGKAQGNAPFYLDYSATNVTTGAYVQLIASLSAASTELHVDDTGGNPLIIATGASGSEVPLVYLTNGGNKVFPINLTPTTRISVKSLSGTSSVGNLILNFFQ